MHKHALSLTCLALLSVAALAGSTPKIPGVTGADDRKPLMRTNAFWTATGKVQVSGFSKQDFCTGVMVAPDIVLTAAHCLTDPVSKGLVKPRRINFLAGLNREANAGHATGTCVRLLGDVVPSDGSKALDRFLADAAVVKLNKSIKAAPVMLAEDASLASGAAATHAGYGRDRRYVLSVHAACQVTGDTEALAMTDCDTTFGQSGGPVFVDDGGTMKLAGIMVGFAEGKGSLALRVKAWRKLLDGAVCKGQ